MCSRVNWGSAISKRLPSGVGVYQKFKDRSDLVNFLCTIFFKQSEVNRWLNTKTLRSILEMRRIST